MSNILNIGLHAGGQKQKKKNLREDEGGCYLSNFHNLIYLQIFVPILVF